ncbi:YggT family protein [Ferrovibrio sp.]|uniref:YggT family protein n=1 Tax=Ferrovibrio sp. TaxID=1917215 RepID=UPI0031201A92
MNLDTDFFWSHLPYWVVAYGLALIGWTCVGRFLMTAFLPPDHPNYIFRFFRLLTNWAIRLTDGITPRFVNPRFLPLVTTFWAFALRYAAHFAFAYYGMAPSLGQGAA